MEIKSNQWQSEFTNTIFIQEPTHFEVFLLCVAVLPIFVHHSVDRPPDRDCPNQTRKPWLYLRVCDKQFRTHYGSAKSLLENLRSKIWQNQAKKTDRLVHRELHNQVSCWVKYIFPAVVPVGWQIRRSFAWGEKRTRKSDYSVSFPFLYIKVTTKWSLLFAM